MMASDLYVFEKQVKKYWQLEFQATEFPGQIFYGAMLLTKWIRRGYSPSQIAHLLHRYAEFVKPE
jgi:hypothetical protein